LGSKILEGFNEEYKTSMLNAILLPGCDSRLWEYCTIWWFQSDQHIPCRVRLRFWCWFISGSI